jgi:uncharacterized delta-60 repeat protein
MDRQRIKILAAILALVALIGCAGASTGSERADAAPAARPGTLDPTFGHGGTAFVRAADATDFSHYGAVAREPNGDVAFQLTRDGSRYEQEREIEMRLPNGALDPSFATDGRLAVPPGSGMTTVSDGDVLIGVERCLGTFGGSRYAVAMLFDPRGAPVASFGRDGCAGGGVPFTPKRIAVDPSGRILLGGTLQYCPGGCGKDSPVVLEPAIARLLPGGGIDQSFGEGGVLAAQNLKALAGDEIGSGEVAGIAGTSDGGAIMAFGATVLRVDEAGAPVSSFGEGGVVKLPGVAAGLTLNADGGFTVASTGNGDGERASGVLVSEFAPTGALDPGFGTAGTTTLPLPGSPGADAISAGPGGGFVIAAESRSEPCSVPCVPTAYLVRLTAAGQLDPTLSGTGIAAVPPPTQRKGVSRLGLALLVEPDGSTLLAGGENGEDPFAFARTETGAPDTDFGEAGTLTEHFARPPSLELTGLAPAPREGLEALAEGHAGPGESGGFLIGLDRRGRQSAGSEGTGVIRTNSLRASLIPQGRGAFVIWSGIDRHNLRSVGVAGESLWNTPDGEVRMPKGFTPDEVVPVPGGGIAAIGNFEGSRPAVFRLGRSGQPVPGFGHEGLAILSFGQGPARAYAGFAEADGDIVVTGRSKAHAVAARVLPDGRLDRSYGHRGVAHGLGGKDTWGSQVVPFAGDAVVALAGDSGRSPARGLTRLDRDGHVVHAFGNDGIAPSQVEKRAAALFTGDGRIVALTRPRGEHHARRVGFELHAYLPNGTVDRGYGRDGVVRAGKPSLFLEGAVQQRGGKIVVAGTREIAGRNRIELMRFR